MVDHHLHEYQMINTKRYKLETRWSLKMSDTLYALIELEDQYLSIISVSTICQPRKEISEYEEGEDIHAKFKGSIYRAVIADIGHTYGRVPYTSSQNGRPNIVFICNKIDSNKGNKAHLP